MRACVSVCVCAFEVAEQKPSDFITNTCAQVFTHCTRTHTSKRTPNDLNYNKFDKFIVTRSIHLFHFISFFYWLFRLEEIQYEFHLEWGMVYIAFCMVWHGVVLYILCCIDGSLHCLLCCLQIISHTCAQWANVKVQINKNEFRRSSERKPLRENLWCAVRTFGNDANTCCFTSQINRSDGNCKLLNTFNSGTWTRTNSHPSRGSGGGSSSNPSPPAKIGAWSMALFAVVLLMYDGGGGCCCCSFGQFGFSLFN